MEFQYNKDKTRRNSILGVAEIDDSFGRFEGLSLIGLDRLIKEKFADPESCQNYSPSISEFYNFMSAHPEFTAHGYAKGLEEDYCVIIEGLQGNSKDTNTILDFVQLNRMADEFDVQLGYQYSWWD